MTKREQRAVVARRREREVIMRGLALAARQELTKPDDVAECVLISLEIARRIDRAVAQFRRHRAGDPHCTCNDCLSYAEGTHPAQTGERT